MGIIGTIIFLVVLSIIVFSFFKSKNLNDNNIIKKIVMNILTFILLFVVYYFVIAIISMIPLSIISSNNNSGSDSGLWAYVIILGMGLAPILSLITIIRLNRKKEKITITNQQNLVKNNNTPVNNKNNLYKIIALIFYNCSILYLILTTDFSDWGGLIMGPMVSLMIFIGNPFLTWIVFRKNNNKGKIIFISFVSTIILSLGAAFFGNPDNINNFIENNKEAKEIKSILNDTNNNIEIYSNDEFKLLINSDKECIYLIYSKKQHGYDATVQIQRNYKLLTLELVQKLIDENTFNEYLLFTKNINNENANITMNIKYKTIDNKEDNQVIFRINDKYYIYENDGSGWMFNDILKENNILQEKKFSIIENETIYKEEDEFDFYADETFDYLILDQKKGYKFEYYQTYKCDYENKSNSERLKEFLKHIEYYNYRSSDDGEYNEYIIKNGKIEKIIIYESSGILSWIEIFPSNLKKSLFIEVLHFPNKEERTIKNSISSHNGSYNISDENIEMLN